MPLSTHGTLEEELLQAQAYKRMCENQETDTDSKQMEKPHKTKKKGHPQRKRYFKPKNEEIKEIQSCLHSLCEENT